MHNVAYLVRKDVLLVYRYMLVLLPVMALLALEGTAGFLLYTAMPAMMLLLMSCSLDMQNFNFRFVSSLPVSRARVVLGKYASAVTFACAGLIFGIAMKSILTGLDESAIWVTGQEIGLALAINLLVASIYLPIYYGPGPRGMQVVNLVFVAIAMLTGVALNVSKDRVRDAWMNLIGENVSPALIGTLGALIGLVLFVASAWISIRLHRRQDV